MAPLQSYRTLCMYHCRTLFSDRHNFVDQLLKLIWINEYYKQFYSYVIVVTHQPTVKMHNEDFSNCLSSSLLYSHGKRLASTLVCSIGNSTLEPTENPSHWSTDFFCHSNIMWPCIRCMQSMWWLWWVKLHVNAIHVKECERTYYHSSTIKKVGKG